jgi:hypothetical protein
VFPFQQGKRTKEINHLHGNLIIQLIAGAVGGNAVGAASKDT